jgi:23S rRNA (uracil1939-C5)-methyltransferase
LARAAHATTMSVQPGQEVEVVVEKPAAGGRMLARHEGQVLFVSGGIPGERILAHVDRVERQLAFARILEVLDPSPDRRAPAGDPACGGCFYAHVAYPRQLTLKAALLADAFGRLGHLPLAAPVPVAPSPEQGYRMRARFHVEGDRVGFYREGTHELCDARDTGHLSEAAIVSVEVAVGTLRKAGCLASTVLIAENVPADQRVLHVEVASAGGADADALSHATAAAGLTGCTAGGLDGSIVSSGSPTVSDSLATLTGGRARAGALERHARSFFQANRFLLPALVEKVLDSVLPDGRVIDLYAGVGLFTVSLAASGHASVIAVEGDRSSAHDLRLNAADLGERIRVVTGSVEDFLRQVRRVSGATIIVDPPRTGISRVAMEAVVALGARRIVYVSCDPATMARDARRLVDGGYRLTSLQAFDLFPNTPHVEAVGIFDADDSRRARGLSPSVPSGPRRRARRTAG